MGSFSFSVVSSEAHTPRPGAIADRQKGSLGPRCAVRLSKQKCGHPVSFEFQMNKEHFFSLTMPHWDLCLSEKRFFVFLRFKVNWNPWNNVMLMAVRLVSRY